MNLRSWLGEENRLVSCEINGKEQLFWLDKIQLRIKKRTWKCLAFTAGDCGDVSREALESTLREQVSGGFPVDVTLRKPIDIREWMEARLLYNVICIDKIKADVEDAAALSAVIPEYDAQSLTVTFRGKNFCSLETAQRFLQCLRERCKEAGFPEITVRLELPLKQEVMENEPPHPSYLISQSYELKRKPVPARRQQNGAADGEEMIYGRSMRNEVIPMEQITEGVGSITVEGRVFYVEVSTTKRGSQIYKFMLSDNTSSITAKLFTNTKNEVILAENIREGAWLRVAGNYVFDPYDSKKTTEYNLQVTGIQKMIPPSLRRDNAAEKRIELHLHTQMSMLDSTVNIQKAIKLAASWGQPALAITDHGVVQSFPEAFNAGKKEGVKVILGMEAYMIADRADIVRMGDDGGLHRDYVAFDFETTGLDPETDDIIEIGATRFRDGKEVNSFQTFVNPGYSIPASITHLTGINDSMIKDGPSINEAITDFLDYVGSDALVAHNATFDLAFLRIAARKVGRTVRQPVLDTLAFSRTIIPGQRRYRLDDIAKRLNVKMVQHHRGDDDARVCGEILIRLMRKAEEIGCETLDDLNTKLLAANDKAAENRHLIILVKNKTGLKNLNRLVSASMLKYMYRGKPRLPKSLIDQHREGLLLGSACEAGELFNALVNGADQETIEQIAGWYDYLEIQPIDNNAFMIRSGQVNDETDLQNLNRTIVKLGEKLGKPVVATGDVHFIEPEDEVFRRILLHAQKYKEEDFQPPLYMRTTEEMLAECAYLGMETARRVVIDNPAKVNDMVEVVDPLPPYKLYAPSIDGSEQQVVETTYATAKDLYGDPLPDIVSKRLEKELASITGYNYSVLYLIAAKLVKKSMEDGYLVGSRGSVGSSLVAYMMGITEVNALPPHYVCPNCQHSDFNVEKDKYFSGPDLPKKNCPVCGAEYDRQGHDIHFEVFLGFKGDKVPDIDLNFSGEYQARAHAYTEELLGKGNVFRAGTIGTVALKTAYGYVQGYMEDHGKVVSNAEMTRLAMGCTGVKRTTGQHPGGLVVVPADMEIEDFTAVQHPADDADSGVITTHFDFNAMHDRLVKLDELGHDDPTVIRMLEDITGVNAQALPLTDPQVMSLFRGTEALGVKPEDIGGCPNGVLGIPEFGTTFVRAIVADTQPTTMAELVRISGLSHGTGVWLGNAQEIIRSGTATLQECICCRDDILQTLLNYHMDSKLSFEIMETVRKGKPLEPVMTESMKAANVPEWFINSCGMIQYLFPRGHAVAYVTMALRIAWFKVYRPQAFYAAYFTIRGTDFDANTMFAEKREIDREIDRLNLLGKKATAKEQSVCGLLEVVREMNARGIYFLPVDLYKSSASTFIIEGKNIRPPFSSLPSVGLTAAKNLYEGAKAGPYLSEEDIIRRTRVSKAVIEQLRKYRCLEGLSVSNQVSLFDGLLS